MIDDPVVASGQVVDVQTDALAIDVETRVVITKPQLAAMEPQQAAALMAALHELFRVLGRITAIENGEIPA